MTQNNRNLGITVDKMLEYLQKEHAKGHGNYKIFVTDDEEANGYHALWYIGTTASELSAEDRTYVESYNCDLCILENKDYAIYMG